MSVQNARQSEFEFEYIQQKVGLNWTDIMRQNSKNCLKYKAEVLIVIRVNETMISIRDLLETGALL